MARQSKVVIVLLALILASTIAIASHTIYSPGENKCLYTPPTGVSCQEGFSYNAARKLCEGTAKPTCLQGGSYDEKLKSCITLADVANACTNGQYIVELGKPKCVASPGNVCAAGYAFVSGKCVRSEVAPKKTIARFIGDPLFLISAALILAAIYLYGKKGRR